MRVPGTRDPLEEIIVFLDDVKRGYAEREAEYCRSGYRDKVGCLRPSAAAGPTGLTAR